jgi:hypothetical protein
MRSHEIAESSSMAAGCWLLVSGAMVYCVLLALVIQGKEVRAIQSERRGGVAEG